MSGLSVNSLIFVVVDNREKRHMLTHLGPGFSLLCGIYLIWKGK